MPMSMEVIGLGGSLRAASTSRAALQVALDGAAAAGAATRLLWVRNLDLPLYTAEHSIPRSARELADTVYSCDAMIWSSPTYHGSISGSFKNVLDWLILLAERDPGAAAAFLAGLGTSRPGSSGVAAWESRASRAKWVRA